jgi:hypothetical protein
MSKRTIFHIWVGDQGSGHQHSLSGTADQDLAMRWLWEVTKNAQWISESNPQKKLEITLTVLETNDPYA